jgi:MarR family transcriptional regulator, lower aerobic nicotinate degradation pathway regulator
MKNSFELIKALMPLIEEYELAQPHTLDMRGFINFIYAKDGPHKPNIEDSGMQMKANQLGFFINYLFKFAKGYTKVALTNSPISTIDDFVFLANLNREASIRKIDLIKQNMMEVPSGVEVIKRLIKSGLVSEFDDLEDKRSVRLQITDEGKRVIYIIFGEMNKVGKVLAGNLNDIEVSQLHGLLEKLFNHHQTIREIDLSEGLEVLLR